MPLSGRRLNCHQLSLQRKGMKTGTVKKAGLAALFLICGHADAADYPPAEPDDREESGLCHAHGKGYVHIPGTKTCLHISGYLRMDIKGADNVYI